MKKFAIFSAVMIIGAGIALAQTLSVPFFRDGTGGTRTTAGFIGVKNTTTNDQTITIVYTSLNASSVPTDLTVTHALAANTGVQWRPVADVGSEGPLGRTVPNNTTIGPDGTNVSIVGSAAISGTGLSGMYRESDSSNSNAFGHTIG